MKALPIVFFLFSLISLAFAETGYAGSCCGESGSPSGMDNGVSGPPGSSFRMSSSGPGNRSCCAGGFILAAVVVAACLGMNRQVAR